MLPNWLRKLRLQSRPVSKTLQGSGRRKGSRRCLPTLESLEDRTLLSGDIPKSVLDDFTNKLKDTLPKLLTNSVGGVRGVPVLGSALAQSLTTDMLATQLTDDIVNNI